MVALYSSCKIFSKFCGEGLAELTAAAPCGGGAGGAGGAGIRRRCLRNRGLPSLRIESVESVWVYMLSAFPPRSSEVLMLAVAVLVAAVLAWSMRLRTLLYSPWSCCNSCSLCSRGFYFQPL